MPTLQKLSPCKINLCLNILKRREDGFHELESILWPVNTTDQLTLSPVDQPGLSLSIHSHLEQDEPIPTDNSNLILKAAQAYLNKLTPETTQGLQFHLEKYIPAGAGLGGGSGNAAVALHLCNEFFGCPFSFEDLWELAASLGSDIPFFLQSQPALVRGRGEILEPFDPDASWSSLGLFIAHPGFGISTAWVYQNLKRFPDAMDLGKGKSLCNPLKDALISGTHPKQSSDLYQPLMVNSLEAPVLPKYPILKMFLEFYKAFPGVLVSRMSGSGSSTFAICDSLETAEALQEKFQTIYGPKVWTQALPFHSK